MAKIHGNKLTHKVNTTAVTDDTRAVDVNISVDTADATTAGNTAKQGIQGAYGWGMDGDYTFNPSSGQNDSVIFNMISSGALNVQVVPGGGTVSVDNPIFRGLGLLTNYSIHIPHNDIVTSRASYQGTSSLTRLTSGAF